MNTPDEHGWMPWANVPRDGRFVIVLMDDGHADVGEFFTSEDGDNGWRDSTGEALFWEEDTQPLAWCAFPAANAPWFRELASAYERLCDVRRKIGDSLPQPPVSP